VSESNPIRVFATHNFEESDDYLRIFEFLESVDRFYYLNVSKPENLPTAGGPQAVKDELMRQVKASEVMIALPELIERSTEHIEWNDREMADALKRVARGENTARWDVVDFPGFDENGPIEN
jgi:hypothetical protein